MSERIITVFGSSSPKPGDKEYEDAYILGRLLGEKGYNVCTGGYQGIMDAVSRGASEAGREAIGVTVEVFSSTPSQFLTNNISCKTLLERIEKLIEYGDVFIVLPGGTGTMLELAVIWEKINKGIIPVKPVYVYGNMWKPIVESMERRVMVEQRKTGLVKCINSINEIVGEIEKELG